MSGLLPKADIRRADQHVRFVPILLQKSVAAGVGGGHSFVKEGPALIRRP